LRFFFCTENYIKSSCQNLIKLSTELQIRLVATHDLSLITEYKLESLPALVFYRHQIPILFEGSLENEKDVHEWLLLNRHTGDNSEDIPDLPLKSLISLIQNTKIVLVYLYDDKSNMKSKEVFELSKNCNYRYINFVTSKLTNEAKTHFVITEPTIILFKEKMEIRYNDDFENVGLRDWLSENIHHQQIEIQNLATIIEENVQVVIFFCKYIAYGVIALTHTCYLLKNYNSFEFKKFLPSFKTRGIFYEY